MAEHLTYFDTNMINQLLGYLDHNFARNFPASYQTTFNKFFRMVESS